VSGHMKGCTDSFGGGGGFCLISGTWGGGGDAKISLERTGNNTDEIGLRVGGVVVRKGRGGGRKKLELVWGDGFFIASQRG